MPAMKSNAARFVGLLLLWWYCDVIGCLFSLFLLYRLGLSLYSIYKQNTSEGEDVLHVNKENDAVVLSGCDSGIGQAVADKLSDSFHVIATVIDPESPAAVALRGKGVIVIRMDLTDDNSINDAMAEIRIALEGRKLHGVVNNAGVCIKGELDWLLSEQVNNMVKINLSGPIYFTKLLLPRIILDKSRLVNVTGLDGLTGTSGLATYCCSKLGMEGFTDSLRLELAKFGVKVITVRPGDYSTLTSAAQDQQKHFATMWAGMRASKQNLCAAEFDAYQKAVTNLSGTLSAANFDGIRATFERIMISANPDDEYDEGNNLNVVAHKIISLLPKACAGKLRSKFVDQLVRIHLYLH